MTEFLPQENSINLYHEFSSLLSNIGTYVIIRRFVNTQKCSCMIDDNVATPNCPLCGGKGYPFIEFPTKAWDMSVQTFSGPNMAETDNKIMEFNEEGKLFFFRVNQKILTSDIIYEVKMGPNQKISLPLYRLSRFDVKTIYHWRGDRFGMIDYLAVFAAENEGPLNG